MKRGASTCSAPPSSTDSRATARFRSRPTIRSPPTCRPTCRCTSSWSTSSAWPRTSAAPRYGRRYAGRQRGHLVLRPLGRVALLRRLPREPHGALVDRPGADRRHRPRAGQPRCAAGGSQVDHRLRARPTASCRRGPTPPTLATMVSAAFPGIWPSSRSSTAKCATCHNGSRGSNNPQLHRHRHDERYGADVHLRPSWQQAERHCRRADDGRLHRLVPLADGAGRDPGRRRRQITGTPADYVNAAAAETSKLMTEHLNPPQRYPLDITTRLVPGSAVHPVDVGRDRADAGRVLPLGAQHRHGCPVLLPGKPG